jgi:uncharacterized protein YciI
MVSTGFRISASAGIDTMHVCVLPEMNMNTPFRTFALLYLLTVSAIGYAADSAVYDSKLADRLGADERGMRSYVLVILKTGPKTVPAGAKRDEMFKGHFANIERLATEGKLALAGPFDGADGWCGMFIFAVSDIEEAKKMIATDPVVINGEMVPEFHAYYGSAALMLVNDAHRRLIKP